MTQQDRFLFYWQRTEDAPIFIIPRNHWDELVGHRGVPDAFDVRSTPIGGVTNASSLIATIAHTFTDSTARVTVLRDDPCDAPNRVNIDHYTAFTDLSSHPHLTEMMRKASVSDEQAVLSLIRDHVFLVKQREEKSDHHSPTIPTSLQLIIDV
jgi:hypothetical protein